MSRRAGVWIASGVVAGLVALTALISRRGEPVRSARQDSEEEESPSRQPRNPEEFLTSRSAIQLDSVGAAPRVSGAEVSALPRQDPLLEVRDKAGVSAEERLAYLVTAHERMLSEANTEKSKGLGSRLNLLRRCIAVLLHSRGRAVFADELDTVRSMMDLDANEYAFSADGAWYRFSRGEFAVFDDVDALARGEPVPAADSIESRTQEIYDEALAVLLQTATRLDDPER